MFNSMQSVDAPALSAFLSFQIRPRSLTQSNASANVTAKRWRRQTKRKEAKVEGAVRLYWLDSEARLRMSLELSANFPDALLLTSGSKYYVEPRCVTWNNTVSYVGLYAASFAYSLGLLKAMHSAENGAKLALIIRATLPSHPLVLIGEAVPMQRLDIIRMIFEKIVKHQPEATPEREFVCEFMNRLFVERECVDFDELTDEMLLEPGALDLVISFAEHSLSALSQWSAESMLHIVCHSEFGRRMISKESRLMWIKAIRGNHHTIDKSLTVIFGLLRRNVLQCNYARLNASVSSLNQVAACLNHLAQARNQLYIMRQLYVWKFGTHATRNRQINVLLIPENDQSVLLATLKAMQDIRPFPLEKMYSL